MHKLVIGVLSVRSEGARGRQWRERKREEIERDKRGDFELQELKRSATVTVAVTLAHVMVVTDWREIGGAGSLTSTNHQNSHNLFGLRNNK